MQLKCGQKLLKAKNCRKPVELFRTGRGGCGPEYAGQRADHGPLTAGRGE